MKARHLYHCLANSVLKFISQFVFNFIYMNMNTEIEIENMLMQHKS